MILQKLGDFITNLPENKTPQAELRMSSAGDCQRKLEYDFIKGPKEVGLQNFMRMETGHYLHDMLRDITLRALGDDFFDCEKEISLTTPDGHVIPGHPDGRIKSLKATLEFKSCSDSTFSMIVRQNKPLDQHLEQANLYASVLKDEWVLIIYFNKDNGKFHEFMFEVDPELAKQTALKFDRVKQNVKAGVLSPRIYTDMSDSPCFYCSHKEDCYSDFKSKVDMALVEPRLTGPLLEKLARLSDQSLLIRTQRLSCEKDEDALKKEVGKVLYNENISSATVELSNKNKAVIKISVGKNNNLLTSIKEIE